LSNAATRRKRFTAGVLAGAMALSVTPVLGFTGVAGAADPAPPVADPIGDGNVCEGAEDSEPFTDVSETDPSYDEIVCLFQAALTTGTGDGTTYSPNGTLTRRQMALFLKRLIDKANELETGDLEDLPEYDGDTDPFTDIDDEDEAFQEAIGQLSQAGITQGVTPTEYRPGDTLSRRQMAQFIVRVLEFLTGEEITPNGDYFDDDNDESDAVEEAFNQVAEEGVFVGDGAGNVDPGGNLSRRQMANVLLRSLQVLFEDGEIEGLFDATPGGVDVTNRPELLSATIVQTTTQGTTVRYHFDEAITSVLGGAGGFHVYNFGTTNGVPVANGTNAQIVSGTTSDVLVTFPGITTASAAAQLSVATVDENIVVGQAGIANNDGNTIGDAGLNPGTTSALTAGRTAAPDLISVGNFRANPADATQTLVDFTFDQNAWNFDGPGGDGYDLVHVNGEEYNDDSSVIAGNGTAVHTVAFENDGFVFGPGTGTIQIQPTVVARGVVYTDVVNSQSDLNGAWNPLHAEPVATGGNSETPDLESAVAVRNQPAPPEFGLPPGTVVDAILYTFDEPVNIGTPGQPSPGGDFYAYLADATPVPANFAIRSTANDTQVAAIWLTSDIDLATGAYVEWQAVQEGTVGQNRFSQEDEVPLSNVGTGTTTESGRTAGPDLIDFAVEEVRDPFGTLTGARARYTFDEDLHTAVTSGDFYVVLADGTDFACGNAVVGNTEDTDNQVTCTSTLTVPNFGTATVTQLLSAVLGSVDDTAVNGQATGTGPGGAASASNGEANPEGSQA
jgi:hypothetical protein